VAHSGRRERHIVCATYGEKEIHITCGTYGEKRDTYSVAHSGRREIHRAFWLGNLKVLAHLEDLGADGKIILKFIFQK
jgi:hypothetical protein